jgi:hypothetical protein
MAKWHISRFCPGVPMLTRGRWFALVRPWAPWLAPRQGKSKFQLDKDALLCSFLSPQGKHMVFLGMSGINDVMTLLQSGGGRLVLHVIILAYLGCC